VRRQPLRPAQHEYCQHPQHQTGGQPKRGH